MEISNNIIKKGVSGFTIKILALGLMTLDHIYQFFSLNGVPIWFTWLGRLSAPLFFFTMAEGFFFTRDRITYLKRLYIFSVAMSLVKYIAWKISISDASYPIVPNNIFETFFLIGVNILLFEFLSNKNNERAKKNFIIFVAIICEIVLPLSIYTFFPKSISKLILSFLPSLLLCEGSFIFVALGIAFFYLRNDRKKMMIVYSFFSLLFLPYGDFTVENAFYHSYQWMMIFSAPLMMLYNEKKGYGLKYLFYFYYPSHILVFFFIAGMLN